VLSKGRESNLPAGSGSKDAGGSEDSFLSDGKEEKSEKKDLLREGALWVERSLSVGKGDVRGLAQARHHLKLYSSGEERKKAIGK